MKVISRWLYIFSVKVDLVFLDDTDKPVEAVDSIKTLQDQAVLEKLAKDGVTVSSVTAQQSGSRPTDMKSGKTQVLMMNMSKPIFLCSYC